MAATTMKAVLASVRESIELAGGAARQQSIRALNRLLLSLEAPDETIHRYGHMSLQAATIKIGLNLGIFRTLAGARGPSSLETLAAEIGADRELTFRILRYLTAIDAIDEVSTRRYAANRVTKNLAKREVEAGLRHFMFTAGPQYDVLPNFLERTGYQNPADGLQTAFQDAWKTTLHSFEWFGQNSEHLSYFNDYMSLRRQSESSWLSLYPVSREANDWNSTGDDAVLYVSVGGGIGHQCKQFREKYPDLPGQVILQDLPHSIAEALPTPGVQNMAHDFFQPQPIKDAKFYHLRGILHDHPPQRVHQILELTKAAMGPHSVLLIDEMILPESGVNYMAASVDMTMLTALAGMERTEAQWRETFERAELELVETFVYAPIHYEGVMHVRLPR